MTEITNKQSLDKGHRFLVIEFVPTACPLNTGVLQRSTPD